MGPGPQRPNFWGGQIAGQAIYMRLCIKVNFSWEEGQPNVVLHTHTQIQEPALGKQSIRDNKKVNRLDF